MIEFGYDVVFEDNVKFEDAVTFEEDVYFYDNLLVEGLDSEDSIDFDIKGHVEFRFDQDEALVIDTETLMRDDVRIAEDCDDSWDHCEESASDDRRGRHERRKQRKLKNDKSSNDEPPLYVEGDATFAADVILEEGDLTVTGMTTLEGTLDVNADVTVTAPGGGLVVKEGSIAYQEDILECWKFDGANWVAGDDNANALCSDVPSP